MPSGLHKMTLELHFLLVLRYLKENFDLWAESGRAKGCRPELVIVSLSHKFRPVGYVIETFARGDSAQPPAGTCDCGLQSQVPAGSP